jgi:hypothetical protein
MPRQNRVTPHGELIAVPDRGMLWGNRGVLVDGQGKLARYSRGQACRLPADHPPERLLI